MPTKRFFTQNDAAAQPPKPRAKRAPKPTVVETVHADVPINVEIGETIFTHNGKEMSREEFLAAHASDSTDAYEQFRAAADNYFQAEGLGDWRRELINITLGLVGYGASFYFTMQLVNVIAAAAISLTGVGFISFMISFLGLIIAFMAAYQAGMAVYQVASKFDVIQLAASARSWFNRNDVEVSHA